MSGISYQHLHFLFCKFGLSVFCWLIWIKVVPSGIFLSSLFLFVFIVSNFVFLATSIPTVSTFVFKIFRLVGTLTNLLTSSSSTSAFTGIKVLLAAKLYVWIPVVSYNLFHRAKVWKFNVTLTLSLMWLSGSGLAHL